MEIDHVAIVVKNISTAISWYQQSVNAEIDYVDETWAMLKIKNSKVALVLEGTHPPHVAFTIKSADQFPANSKIKTHRDGSRYAYQSDEQGNIIEFILWPE